LSGRGPRRLLQGRLPKQASPQVEMGEANADGKIFAGVLQARLGCFVKIKTEE